MRTGKTFCCVFDTASGFCILMVKAMIERTAKSLMCPFKNETCVASRCMAWKFHEASIAKCPKCDAEYNGIMQRCRVCKVLLEALNDGFCLLAGNV